MYVPKKYYVGFQSRGDDCLLGFFTPDDGDTNSTKRKATVDKWASGKIPAAEINNEPRTGFRIVDTARRYSSNNVLFRILHPEVGAEFEISAENLNELHQQCIIEYGEIKTELFFIRKGNDNLLVVKDSVQHKKALQDMEIEAQKQKTISSIKKKDIKEGMEVKLSSRYGSYVFLGTHSISYVQQKQNNSYYSYSSTRKILGYEYHNFDDKYFIFAAKNRDGYSIVARKTFPKIEKIITEDSENSENEKITIDSIKHKINYIIGIDNTQNYNQILFVDFDTHYDSTKFEYVPVINNNLSINSSNLYNDFNDKVVLVDTGDGINFGIVCAELCYVNRQSQWQLRYSMTININDPTSNQTKVQTVVITDPNTKFYNLGYNKKV